jgi:glycosyltransferase involved in cell wall biosynthesis
MLLEGSRRREDLPEQYALSGFYTRQLHWRPDTRALLPGSRSKIERHSRAAGQLAGLWSLLSIATVSGISEALEIIQAARSLGMRVAVQTAAEDRFTESDIAILAAGDIALFATPKARDAALAQGLRALPKTVNLTYRFRAAADFATAASVLSEASRISAAGPPRRPARLYYWVGLTVETPFNTGVQRVTRQLAVALGRAGIKVVPIKWDKAIGRMVTITAEEAAHLARWGGPKPEIPEELPKNLAGEWLLVPEITVPVVPPSSNAARVARGLGMRVAAIFYDIIPLKMPEIYPAAALDDFKQYWELFSEVDVALPISWTVSAELHHYLTDVGLPVPRLVPCPLAGEFAGTGRRMAPRCGPAPFEPLELLAVGTWEPRKNYPRLLRAVAEARRLSGKAIHLTIVGRRANLMELDNEIERIASELGGVTLLDHVSDEELLDLYDRCHSSVFASWEEGFGLPVLESLWRGLPCICHDGSALVELLPGGGTLHVDMLNETAIAHALARLACEDDLVSRLSQEAVSRPIRTWGDYAADVIVAMTEAGTAPGWPLPMIAKRRPLLSCAITTYNRAAWLKHSLPRLLEATLPWRDAVEIAVCDNASTDETPDVISRYAREPGFVARRNSFNVGMLGNLGATAKACRGAFIWLLGDDDLIVDHALEQVLEGLAAYPDVEMAYMNYGYTHFSSPEELADADHVIREAKPIAQGGPNRHVSAVREVAGLNENLFTAIYACAFRRDHALRAYQQDVRGAPFSSLSTCVPSSTYALTALQDRPAWWVGEPAVVVNMNVSWLRWALLWHLERMPDLYDLAERAGIDPGALGRYRMEHCREADVWARRAYFEAEHAIREHFSMARLLERCKHRHEFREVQVPKLRQVYDEAWRAGRVIGDTLPPEELFFSYGLAP